MQMYYCNKGTDAHQKEIPLLLLWFYSFTWMQVCSIEDHTCLFPILQDSNGLCLQDLVIVVVNLQAVIGLTEKYFKKVKVDWSY